MEEPTTCALFYLDAVLAKACAPALQCKQDSIKEKESDLGKKEVETGAWVDESKFSPEVKSQQSIFVRPPFC